MENLNLKTIEINGEEYIRKADVPNGPILETDHVIIIAQRGWIFEGYRVVNYSADTIRLVNANVVRKWANGRGIGGLIKKEYKDEYVLDPVGTVDFPPESIIATFLVEW